MLQMNYPETMMLLRQAREAGPVTLLLAPFSGVGRDIDGAPDASLVKGVVDSANGDPSKKWPKEIAFAPRKHGLQVGGRMDEWMNGRRSVACRMRSLLSRTRWQRRSRRGNASMRRLPPATRPPAASVSRFRHGRVPEAGGSND